MPIVVYVDKYNGPPYSIRLGTCGSVGIEVLEFRFSPEWDGLQKRITFYANIGELAAPFLIPDSGILPLPAQATVKAGRYEAVIDGCGTDSRVIFSTSIMCEVLFHAPAGTSPPPEYTPDEYQQFISAVHGDRQRAEDAAALAGECAEQAEDAKDGAETAAMRYPEPRNGTWWVYDPLEGKYVDTRQSATGEGGELEEASNEDIDNIFRDLVVQKRSF